MTEQRVRVGLVQHACDEDRKANIERALLGIDKAAQQGAKVVCLQELFGSLYFGQTTDPQVFDWAEPLDGPTVRAVSLAAKRHGITILTGIFERRTQGLYHNSLVVLGPEGQTLGVYRKMHLPDDPQFHEKFYFAPGDLGFMAVDTPECRVGTLICWDQWYPEAARLTALQGAQILFYPTAIGWLPEEKAEFGQEQLEAWQTIQRAHSIANGVFTVAVNRVGVERSRAGAIEFWGHSFVCDPAGKVLAQAGTEEQVLVVECDLRKIDETRRIWPFFRDRRVDAYQGLVSRWGGQGGGR